MLEQTKQGTPTYFYVVQRASHGFRVFRALLLSISATAPQSAMLPSYYDESNLAKGASLWVEVEHFSPVDGKTLDALRIDATGNPVLQVLSRSMACVMIVS
ncbi:MAG: hypothetical protein ACYCSP_12980 [Acidobacteriaceae bacterium]